MKTDVDAIKNDIKVCTLVLKRNLVTIALFGVLGLLIGSLATVVPPPDIYLATGSISRTTVVSSSSSSATATYGDLLQSSVVLDEVLSRVGGVSKAELSSMLSTDVSLSKGVLYIYAFHQDPAFAIKVANAATEAMFVQINDVFGNPGIMILDLASSAKVHSSSVRAGMLYRAFAAALGSIGCGAYYVIKTILSDNIFTVEGCLLGGELDVIGVIPYAPGKAAKSR